MQEALRIDKLIQGLHLHKKGEYEDPFYLYCALLNALRYGISMKECVGMHIIDNIFSCYYDDYKWCKSCDYTACNRTCITRIFLTKNKTNSSISSLLNSFFKEKSLMG